MTHQIRYDDIESLRGTISADYGEWGPQLLVTQELIDAFADLTGDHQWIHVDEEKAKKGPFGTTIAHGLLTLSLITRIRPPSSFVVAGQGNTINYGSDGFRFVVPVRVNSNIHARSRVKDVQAHPRGTRLTLELAVHIVDEERPSLLFETIILYAPPASDRT